jgi:hypothetical protein
VSPGYEGVLVPVFFTVADNMKSRKARCDLCSVYT